MQVFVINFWPILASAVVIQIIGFLWYSPILFGKWWMGLVKMAPEKEAMAKKKSMAKPFTVMFISNLVISYVLGIFIANLLVTTAWEGVQLGFWIWLGFVATTSISEFLWSVDKKPWGLYILNNSYNLVSFIAAGALLAVWI